MPRSGNLLGWRWPVRVLCWPRLAMNWAVPRLGCLVALRGLDMGCSKTGLVFDWTWSVLCLGFPFALLAKRWAGLCRACAALYTVWDDNGLR